MTHEIVMPQLGLTMTEGSVTTWLKKPGEQVERGEILFTVQTDKVEMEVESFVSGYVDRILVDPEQVVPVGTLIATLSDGPPGTATPQPEAGGIVSSPRARRVAQELGIDLATVTPAKGRRITEDDVRRHQGPAKSEAPLPAARRVIAQRMSASFQTAPHFYLGVEANASELVNVREALVHDSGRGTNVKLTYTDFFLKALATALADHPHVNQYWRDGQITRHDSIDVGCAVQAADGLLVPVIRNAGRMSLFAIAERRSELVDRARAGRLSLAEMEGGSATLSNLGHAGVDWFQAILNPPQSVIVATGRIAARAVVVNNQVQAQPTVHINISVDHRVLDGASGAAFLKRMQELIEKPYLLLV